MDMKLQYNKMKNRKAMSGVVTAVIMIGLVMVAAVIVWTVVRNIIQDRLEGVESCFGIYEKVTINSRYTCYDNPNFQFSISIKDIEVDSIIVSISGAGTSNSYTLTNQNQTISGLVPYPSGSGEVILPEKNAGLTYVASGFSEKPDLIQIAPVIDGQQCEVSASLSEIDMCSSLT